MAIFQNLKVPNEEESLDPEYNENEDYSDPTDGMDFTDGYPDEPDVEEPDYTHDVIDKENNETVPDSTDIEQDSTPQQNDPYAPLQAQKDNDKDIAPNREFKLSSEASAELDMFLEQVSEPQTPVEVDEPEPVEQEEIAEPRDIREKKQDKTIDNIKTEKPEEDTKTPKKRWSLFGRKKPKPDKKSKSDKEPKPSKETKPEKEPVEKKKSKKEEQSDEETQKKIPSYDPVKEAEQIMTPEKTWVLVKQIGALSEEERKAVYGHTSIDSILSTHTAAQARQKYIEWENANRLNVGDQVVAQDQRGRAYFYWVTYIDETGYINGIEDNGRVRIAKVTDIQKTGRKKDIQKLLNQLVMQETKRT